MGSRSHQSGWDVHSSAYVSNLDNWNGTVRDITHGANPVTTGSIKIKKALDPEMEECPVTFMIITGDYIQCCGCNKCFDISVRHDWIMVHHTCPHCRRKWKEDIVYSQSTEQPVTQPIERKNNVKSLEPGMETCPVTCELITGDYIQCGTCHLCFDISVRTEWIKNNNNCPYCGNVWINNTSYSQP